MKLYFKYSIMILFVLCLNWLMAQASPTCHIDIPATNTCSKFEFSQEKDNHRLAIENIANCCSRMTCDKVDTSSSDVPTAKYFQRFIGIYKEFCSENISAKNLIDYNFTACLSDPNTYYVFGLRKIII